MLKKEGNIKKNDAILKVTLITLLVTIFAFFVISGPIQTFTASSPANGTNSSTNDVEFNCTYVMDELGGANAINATNISLFFSAAWTDNVFVVNQTNLTSADAEIQLYNNTPYNFTVLNLPEGELTWYCELDNGSASLNRNVTLNMTLWVDTTNPTITFDYPAEAYNSSVALVNFNWTVTDNVATYLYCNVTLDSVLNSTIATLDISINATTDNYTIENIPHGVHEINVTCYDWAFNNVTSESRNFTVYTTVPAITLNYPANIWNSSTSKMVFNWTAYAFTNDPALTCNLTIDNVTNLSNMAVTNGTLNTQTITGLSVGSHYWNVTCMDWLNHSNTSVLWNYTRIVGPLVHIDRPLNASNNVSNLTMPLFVRVSDIGQIWYSLDGSYNNITLCYNCLTNKTNLSLMDYGDHYVYVYSNDTSGNLNVTRLDFSIKLDTDGNGTIDDADDNGDDDGDGISDGNDTITGGNWSLINSNLNISGMINGFSNLSTNFSGLLADVHSGQNGTAQLNISTNGSNGVIVSMTYNFSNFSKLILPNVTIDAEKSTDTFGKIVVRNLPPSPGTNKTVWVNKLNTTHRWVCVADYEPGLNTTLTPTCGMPNETLVDCTNGSINGNLRCIEEGGRLKVSGLSYSIVQAMCRENWTISAWSNCQIGGTQTRTATDNNGCGTIVNRAVLSQGCTYGSSAGSTTTSSSTDLDSADTVEEKLSYIVGTILQGEARNIPLSNDKIGITSITVKIKEKADGVKIVVEKLAEKPVNVLLEAPGKIYAYWKFSNVNLLDSNIEEAKISFKVSRSWLNENDLNTGDIVLSRYTDEKWTDAETTVTKSEESFVYYEADVGGFSYFAVRANYKAEASEEVVEEEIVEEEKESLVSKTVEKVKSISKDRTWLKVLMVLILLAVIGGTAYFLKAYVSKNKQADTTRTRVKIKPKK